MKTFEVCVVSKEYRTVHVQAEDEGEAKDKVWDDIESILNGKAEDYDTDLYIESESSDAASYT